jgi:hypothetical protein
LPDKVCEKSSESTQRSDTTIKRKVKLLKVITEVTEPEDPESDEADMIEATENDKKHRLSRGHILEIAQKLNKHLRWHCIAPLPGSSTKPRKFESYHRLQEMLDDISRMYSGNFIEIDDDDVYLR